MQILTPRDSPVPRPRTIQRHQIIDAALHLLTTEGIDKVTISAIARAAGVSGGAIYNFFESKEELIEACIQDVEWSPGDYFKEMIHRSDPANPERRSVQELLEGAAQFATEFYGRKFSAIVMYTVRPDLGTVDPELPRRNLAILMEYFSREMANGRIRPADPETLTRGFLGALFAYVFFERVINQRSREEILAGTFARSWAAEFWQGIKPMEPDHALT